MTGLRSVAPDEKLLRLPEVLRRVPFGRSTIYKRMGEGTFPESIDCGGNVRAWYESDVLDWLSRPATWRAPER